jgi:SAM-dependent methyltransferase
LLFSQIKEKFIDNCSIGENDPHFHSVDGLRDPSKLLLAPTHNESSTMELKVPESLVEEVKNSVLRVLCSSLVDFRHLTGEGSYEKLLDAKDIKKLLETYCVLSDISKASVVDFGCGQGNALAELSNLDCINEKNVIGITLPLRYMDGKAPHVTNFRNPNVLTANILHLSSKKEFDIAISVFGVGSYHPFEAEFGLLHIMAFLKEKGLLLIAPDYESSKLIPELIKSGILERPDGFKQFGLSVNGPYAYVLKRKPSHLELCKLAVQFTELEEKNKL